MVPMPCRSDSVQTFLGGDVRLRSTEEQMSEIKRRAEILKQQREKRRNKALIVCLALLLAVAIGVIVWLITRPGDEPALPAENTTQTSQSAKENGGLVVPERPEMIDVTAYESLKLKADTLEQSVRFENPVQNNCWMVITLSLEDGTELWKSEELEPGQVLRSITLNQPLAAGEYENAVLSYQHWTYDEEKLPLNGAETLVKLTVGQ